MAACLPRFRENGFSWGSEVQTVPLGEVKRRFRENVGWRLAYHGSERTVPLGEVKLLWMAACLPRFRENGSSWGSEVTLDGGLPTTVHGGGTVPLGVDGDGGEDIALASNIRLQKLSIAKTFYVDVMFYSAPRILYQIISIHAFVMGVMMPLVFGFLPNKSTSMYMRFLTLVENNAAALRFIVQPLRLMMHFELGRMNAQSTVFPGVQVKGCYFHYSQCLYRKLQNTGLSVPYRENLQVREWFRRLLALPVVPAPQQNGP